MAVITREQVQAAHREGHAAGESRQPPLPNPYAPEHVPPWRVPIDAHERYLFERRRRYELILARVWRAGFDKGRDVCFERRRVQRADRLLGA
jgi:hypothetical protein